jgi:hypothetical protein
MQRGMTMQHTITVKGKQHTINIDIDELVNCQRSGIEMYYNVFEEMAAIRALLDDVMKSSFTDDYTYKKLTFITNIIQAKENKHYMKYKDIFGH